MTKVKLKLDVIKARDESDNWQYLMISKASDKVFMVNLSHSGIWNGGEITVNGGWLAPVESFEPAIQDLIRNLRYHGYTDIKKVTLEAREV